MEYSDRGFVELLCKTNFSFLEAASFPHEMIAHAKSSGFPAVGIVDTNGVYGIARAHAAAKAASLNLIVGAEIRLQDTRLFALAKNKAGYNNLCEILSAFHRLDTPPKISDFPIVFEKSENLFFFTHSFSEQLRPLPSLHLIASAFFDSQYPRAIEAALEASTRFQIPVIASNEPLFHTPERKPLHDVLQCIRHRKTLHEAGLLLLPNSTRYLKTAREMAAQFKAHPQWLDNTVRIAGQCAFSLDEIHYHYPNEWLPAGETGDSYLRQLVYNGARRRYGDLLSDSIRTQVERELKLICELRYADYFLTIWDIVQFAQSRSILFQGRGSAANSIVCFVLGITAIDPIRMDLLFERFISRERKEPPDIDIDFEHERREEVIQYIYRRYGRHRAAITAEVICFRRRSAIREVGKAMGLSANTVEILLTHTHRTEKPDWNHIYLKCTDHPRKQLEKFTQMAQLIRGFPRHLGTHVGGFVLCQDDLSRNVPIETAAMPGRTIIQWDKNDLDCLGFVRVDILGLGILTCLRKSFELLSSHYRTHYTIASIPAEDPKVYDSICRADTVGVFQIESRAQMNMLGRLLPRNFFDLVIEIALVRPGPIQGNMVHPYLRRRNQEESIEYAHPELEGILHKTLGVPLFQEQIMKIAIHVAGFTPGEADALRRAIGTWRKDGSLHHMGARFKEGLMARGIAPGFCDQIFNQIKGFAEYGFPESHAASFAVLTYATAFIKTYYPSVYLTALLNSQPMGFYSSHTLIHDAQRHGVKILPIDINQSDWDNQLESPQNVRLGFREIKGLSKNLISSLLQIRLGHAFTSLDDLVGRLRPLGLSRRDLFLLANANAFDCFHLSRRNALWEIAALPLPDSLYMPTQDTAALPQETSWEKITLDYESSGVSLFAHPMSLWRERLKERGVLSSAEIRRAPDRQKVKTAGLVICRQMPPTAAGILFITLEDEFGFINLVISNTTYQRYKESSLTQSFLLCEGSLQKSNLQTHTLEPLLKHYATT